MTSDVRCKLQSSEIRFRVCSDYLPDDSIESKLIQGEFMVVVSRQRYDARFLSILLMNC